MSTGQKSWVLHEHSFYFHWTNASFTSSNRSSLTTSCWFTHNLRSISNASTHINNQVRRGRLWKLNVIEHKNKRFFPISLRSIRQQYLINSFSFRLFFITHLRLLYIQSPCSTYYLFHSSKPKRYFYSWVPLLLKMSLISLPL